MLTNTSLQENGSFLCVAENKAGRAQANYSVQVEPRQPGTLVMEMRMEHFIAVSVCVIVILVLLMIIVTILLVKIARKHLEPEPAKETAKPYKASSMPRSIQMGTGAVFSGQARPAPDLLSGVSHSQSSSEGSMVSVETVATPLGQEPAPCRAQDMRDIIRELGSEAATTQPLIGGQLPSWSVDNPYLHTSHWSYRQRLPVVRPDQQYPVMQYPSTDQQYPILQYPHPTYPLEATTVPHSLAAVTAAPPSDNNSSLHRKLNPDYISPDKISDEKYLNGTLAAVNGSDYRTAKADTSEPVSSEQQLDREIEGINEDMEAVLRRMVSTCWSEGTNI